MRKSQQKPNQDVRDARSRHTANSKLLLAAVYPLLGLSFAKRGWRKLAILFFWAGIISLMALAAGFVMYLSTSFRLRVWLDMEDPQGQGMMLFGGITYVALWISQVVVEIWQLRQDDGTDTTGAQ